MFKSKLNPDISYNGFFMSLSTKSLSLNDFWIRSVGCVIKNCSIIKDFVSVLIELAIMPCVFV